MLGTWNIAGNCIDLTLNEPGRSAIVTIAFTPGWQKWVTITEVLSDNVFRVLGLWHSCMVGSRRNVVLLQQGNYRIDVLYAHEGCVFNAPVNPSPFDAPAEWTAIDPAPAPSDKLTHREFHCGPDDKIAITIVIVDNDFGPRPVAAVGTTV